MTINIKYFRIDLLFEPEIPCITIYSKEIRIVYKYFTYTYTYTYPHISATRR